jgi:YVTN family beta-propeller protein
MAGAHGGQVLLSARTTDLIAGELPTNVSLRRVGTYLLKDFDRAEPLAQLDVGGLPTRFPPVRADRQPSPVARFVPRPVRRHPIVTGASALAVAGSAVALVLLLQPTPPAPQANALAEIDAGTAKLIRFVPVGDTPSSVVTANGSVWVTNAGEATVSRVDPRQGRVVRTIPVPGTPVGIVGGGGALWVINSDLAAAQSSVTRIDPRYARVTGTRTLPKSDLIGSGAGITWDGKSLWAVTQAGSAFQIDASTLRVSASVTVGDDPTSLVAAKGSVWVANRRGSSVSRIQAPATVTQTVAVGSGPSAIAAGAGSIWVADTGEDSVRRIDPKTGSVLATIPVGQGPDAIAASDQGVWVANEDDRTVMRIDPRTNRVAKTVHVGLPPAALSLAGGRVWVAVQKPTISVPAEGQVLHVLSGAPGIIDSLDPPLAYTLITWQIEYSTCAKLLNYPDRPAPAGYRLEPEIARALPAVSHGGRTYTFRIRRGFRFSPPSNQAVTARTFKYSIERALAPGTKSFAVRFFPDIVGAAAYESGKAKHLAGVVARGDTLTISLARPSGDLPARLAMPFFCPVPIGTPADFRGLSGVPSAGPYFVASYTPNKSLILRSNPNYRGRRPHRFRAIELRSVASEEQADGIVEQDNADLVIDEHGGIPIPKRYRWRLHHFPVGAVHYLVLNTVERPFTRCASGARPRWPSTAMNSPGSKGLAARSRVSSLRDSRGRRTGARLVRRQTSSQRDASRAVPARRRCTGPATCRSVFARPRSWRGSSRGSIFM